MSNFITYTKHPETGKWEKAEWLDDYFGEHEYGIRFPDGKIFRSDKFTKDDVKWLSKSSQPS